MAVGDCAKAGSGTIERRAVDPDPISRLRRCLLNLAMAVIYRAGHTMGRFVSTNSSLTLEYTRGLIKVRARPDSPMAEAEDLKSFQCRFESDSGHSMNGSKRPH